MMFLRLPPRQSLCLLTQIKNEISPLILITHSIHVTIKSDKNSRSVNINKALIHLQIIFVMLKCLIYTFDVSVTWLMKTNGITVQFYQEIAEEPLRRR